MQSDIRQPAGTASPTEAAPPIEAAEAASPTEAAEAAPPTEAAEAVWDAESAAGGDPACWAHLVCQECGAVMTDGHREGCPSDPAEGSAR